jgi:hypothetical protein
LMDFSGWAWGFEAAADVLDKRACRRRGAVGLAYVAARSGSSAPGL